MLFRNTLILITISDKFVDQWNRKWIVQRLIPVSNHIHKCRTSNPRVWRMVWNSMILSSIALASLFKRHDEEKSLFLTYEKLLQWHGDIRSMWFAFLWLNKNKKVSVFSSTKLISSAPLIKQLSTFLYWWNSFNHH